MNYVSNHSVLSIFTDYWITAWYCSISFVYKIENGFINYRQNTIISHELNFNKIYLYLWNRKSKWRVFRTRNILILFRKIGEKVDLNLWIQLKKTAIFVPTFEIMDVFFMLFHVVFCVSIMYVLICYHLSGLYCNNLLLPLFQL